VIDRAPSQRITPVILCGGEGTRLSPLSSAERPKYLLKGWSSRTILQETILRVSDSAIYKEPILFTSTRTETIVRTDAAKAAGAGFTLIAEPAPRSTCPPLITAAILASKEESDALLLALPSDHYIEDLGHFTGAVIKADGQTGQGKIALFGVTPKSAETGYGYIECANEGKGGEVYKVISFHEKPSRERAEAYLKSGNYLINSGIALFKASTLLAYAKKFLPKLLERVEESIWDVDTPSLQKGYEACQKISFDHAVLEGPIEKVCVELQTGWSDLGTIESIRQAALKYQSERGSLFNAIRSGLPLTPFKS